MNFALILILMICFVY